MTFENPSRQIPMEQEMENNKERLEEALSEVIAELKAKGIAVDDECRVDMSAFKEARDDASTREQREVDRLEELFKDRARENRGVNSEQVKGGEILEKLKTVTFHKFLKGKFYTMRTSKFDDFKGGVDNLIIDANSGAIVGAFDEVVDKEGGSRFNTKQDQLFSMNYGGGASIRYAFDIDSSDEETIIKPSNEIKSGVPVFYLALDGGRLERALDNAGGVNEISDADKNLFKYFLKSMISQAEELLGMVGLDDKVRETTTSFLNSIKDIKI